MQKGTQTKGLGKVDEVVELKSLIVCKSDIVSLLKSSTSKDLQLLLLEGAIGSGKTDLLKRMGTK